MTKREEQVLAYVNRLRAKRGHPSIARLPKGKIGKTEACTLACAFTPEYVEVDVGSITFYDGPELLEIYPPQYVSRFVEDFDDGKFPHLVAQG